LCYWLPHRVANYLSIFIIIPFEFLFFSWLFYKNLYKKPIVIWGSCLYIFAYLLEHILFKFKKDYFFFSFSYSIGNIILLIFILMYFYKLTYSERILFFYKEKMFWVALGCLIFYLGTFPYYGIFNLLLKNHYELLVSYTWVEIFLDYTMYLLFAASFIWGKEK
jgi:hypothetical protein